MPKMEYVKWPFRCKELFTNVGHVGDMRWLLISMMLLAGCDTPSPHFRGIQATRVEVDDSVFDVRVRDNLAEAIRINPEYAPRFGPIRARAELAMTQVSGCEVIDVLGDQALATGVLACQGRPPEWLVPVGYVSYSCLEVSQWVNEGPGRDYAEFECDPV